ncbi:hypothetical protein [Candidatus Albibeggiatoa sp. nov. NOAA]|uniref:hypothetical protein n=1 Tax=Candidatus Albibeggiatoa sp. nov. NOAA TaxID=3162724 RepID=UPI0032F21321|nr:hypothetical protein [Thiotrichaceae bacterium]
MYFYPLTLILLTFYTSSTQAGILGADNQSQINGNCNVVIQNSNLQQTYSTCSNDEGIVIENFDIDYARFFGAYRALNIIYNYNTGEKGETICQIPRGSALNVFAAYDNIFKNTWKYENAIPIGSRAWNELFACGQKQYHGLYMNETLLKIACSKSSFSSEITRWLNTDNSEAWGVINTKYTLEPDIYGIEEMLYYFQSAIGGTPADKLTKEIEKCSTNVGFLLLYLTNSSKKAVVDVSVNYQEFKNNHLWELGTSASHVQEEITQSKIHKRLIPKIESSQTLLWLLAVYVKDANGFPESYLSSVVLPKSIQYRFRGSSEVFKEKIRLPYKENAMRYNIPFGWYGQ